MTIKAIENVFLQDPEEVEMADFDEELEREDRIPEGDPGEPSAREYLGQ